MRKTLLVLGLLSLSVCGEAQTKRARTVFQGFYWNYRNDSFPARWANYVTELAPRLKSMGFDAVWLPPVYKNAALSSVGYSPFDHYDLGDKFQKGGSSLQARTPSGTKDELLRAIAVLHANGIEVVHDIVLNHIDGAGTNNGTGGVDPETNFSMVTNGGFKNFRYVSYATPLLNDGQDDYFSRRGRWAKNFTNFHPNASNNCTTGDICQPFFGPDIDFGPNAIGLSSNIPTTGNATVAGVTRPFSNGPQAAGYMRDGARNWFQWFKRQTGADGWRWDAVKHFPIAVQEDLIYNSKYSQTAGFNGGQDMLCIGEWIGNRSDLDNYVNNIRTGLAPGGVANEKHTGTFDFALRGYGPNGGLYSMVLAQGGYNMQNIPGEQQAERFMDYPGNKRIYRTVPFVNSHDTYRPILLANGNFSKPLGDNTGWNTGQQLGGNGQHIDPREPRLAAAYAVTAAVDGNPMFFIEDLFDLGTTGRRFNHLPSDTVALPARPDLVNIVQAHQALRFKDGDYSVPTALTGGSAPFYQKGTAANHLVIERIGRAIIGITDRFSTVANNSDDEEVWVTVDASMIGRRLYDYSGAHDTTGSQVFADRRVLIRTAPVNHTIPNALGHGYSIWAPLPAGATLNSVNDLYAIVRNGAANRPASSDTTTLQEWEMADDLGDSHCSSLTQGGALPANSLATRLVGKIYTAANRPVVLNARPATGTALLKLELFDLEGNKLWETMGRSKSDSALTGTYNANAEGWLVVKISHAVATQPATNAFVQARYQAPRSINTRSAATQPSLRQAIWKGLVSTSMTDCANWEEGKLPDLQTDAVIKPAPFQPTVSGFVLARDIRIDSGAVLNRLPNSNLFVRSLVVNGTITGNGIIRLSGDAQGLITGRLDTVRIPGVVVVENAAGTQLQKHLVADTLEMSVGNLLATTTSVMANIYVGGSPSSFIEMGGTTVQTNTVSTLLVAPNMPGTTIPVGIANSYSPIEFSGLTGPATLMRVRLLNNVLEQGDQGVAFGRTDIVRRTWLVYPSNATAPTTIRPYWFNAMEGATFNRSNALFHFKRLRPNTAWTNWVAVANTTSEPYRTSSSPFVDTAALAVFSFNATLPVRFTQVKANALNERQAVVQFGVEGWAAGDVVTMEKSADGQRFEKLALVEKGSSLLRDEQFTGKAFYRLKAVSADGKTAYSSVALAEWKNSGIRLMPNPTTGTLFLQMNERQALQTWEARLMTANGSLVMSVRGNQQTLNAALAGALDGKPAGLYQLSLQQGKEQINLLVQKQ